jgi:hypothetical protein
MKQHLDLPARPVPVDQLGGSADAFAMTQQPCRQSGLVPVFRAIAQPGIALQIGNKTSGAFAGCIVDIDLATLGDPIGR